MHSQQAAGELGGQGAEQRQSGAAVARKASGAIRAVPKGRRCGELCSLYCDRNIDFCSLAQVFKALCKLSMKAIGGIEEPEALALRSKMLSLGQPEYIAR